MDIIEDQISYDVDGHRMVGHLARPKGDGHYFGALVAHEAPGCSGHTRDVARRLARLGMVAFAFDYQGDGVPKSDMAEVMTLIGKWHADPGETNRRSEVALKVLLDQPGVNQDKIVAIGYCFGGTTVLELARTGAKLAAVIGFHPGLAVQRPEASRSIVAPVLMLVGARDCITPAEHRHAFEAEMDQAGVDWRLNVYGNAKHSFTNPDVDAADIPGIGYDDAVNHASWRAMLDFLNEKTGFDASAFAQA